MKKIKVLPELTRAQCARGSVRKLKNGAVICCPKGGGFKAGRCPVGFAGVRKARR